MAKSSSPAVDFKTTENHIISDLKSHPNDMQAVFKELHQLQGSESLKDFRKDLIQLNKDLHEKGLLPNLEIVDDPTALDGFKTQPDSSADPSSSDSSSPSAPSEQPWVNPNGDSGGGGGGGGGSSGGGGGGGGGSDSGGGGGGSAGGDGGGTGGGGGATGPGNFDGYSGNVTGDGTQNAILNACNADINKAMWQKTDGGASGGVEGCAASVSAVLDQAGAANVHEMECHHLQSALEGQGWSQTTKPQPGDVVIGYGGLSAAHTGIVGANGKVYDNHSSSGTWQQDDLSYFKNWNQVVFLHKDNAGSTAVASNKTTNTHHA